MSSVYETDRSLNEYLLLHYGTDEELLPCPFGPHTALGYAHRSVTELLDAARLPTQATALDLGCAVGRSSFALAAHCESVTGIDYSAKFILAAQALASGTALSYRRMDEGELFTKLVAVAPTVGGSVHFETGDAMNLRPDLGSFDVVHMANLIDRLTHPHKCLAYLPELVRSGGQLLLSSPFTWMEEFTPRENWIGGVLKEGTPRTTLDGLKEILEPDFVLEHTIDLPFLIREHARKYQWSIACGTRWVRR